MSTQGQGDVADNAAYLREWAADIRKSNGKSVDADRLDSIAAEIDDLKRAARNRDMWKGQCERQADELTRLRALLSSSRGEQAVRERLTSALKDFLVYYHGTDEQQAVLQADFSGPDGMLPDAEVRSLVFRNAQKALAESWELDGTIPSAPGPVPTSADMNVVREALVTASMALTAHNDWHLKRTDPEVLDGVEHIPAEAYAESTLYELTDDALNRIKVCETGSVPTSAAGQVPDGYVLVPKDLTLEVERSIAYAVAVARQGASSTPRCESPTEYDIDTAHAWVRRVVAALSKRFSMPPSRDFHSRDCEYVTTDGPAPCTCGFVERDCNAAVARAALQSSPQPTAGEEAAGTYRNSMHSLDTFAAKVEFVLSAASGHPDHWSAYDRNLLHIAQLADDALSAERARVIEECARVAEAEAANARSRGALDISQEYTAPLRVAAALRALAQQDTGEQ